MFFHSFNIFFVEPYFGLLSGAGNIGGKGVEGECRCGGRFDIQGLSEELQVSRGLTQSAIQNGEHKLGSTNCTCV